MFKGAEVDNYQEIEKVVRSVVFNFVKKNPQYSNMVSDLLQEGMVKALEVMRKFDPSKGVKMKTFLSRCIKNEIINRLKEEASRSKILGAVEEMEIVDTRSLSYDLNLLEKQISAFIESNPSLFSEEDREIINLRVMGYKYEEIAKKIGKNKKYIDNSLQKIKRIISEKFKL
ncbi:MAG: sigma-70 family RNA polymerase sigma factor [Brevinematia bacterium]